MRSPGLAPYRFTPAARLRLLPWLSPVALVAIWKLQPAQFWPLVDKAIPALLALAVLLLASRRPKACLVALLALMPYQVFFPAWLYKMGVPLGIIRPITGWREVMGLAIALAAVRTAKSDGHRLDTVSVVGFGYVALVAAYALVPTLFAEGAPTDSDVLSQAFRASAGLVLLLLACRHAPFDFNARELADRALRWTAVVVALFAVWEFVDGDGWNNWVVHTLEVTRYQILVLNSPVYNPADVRTYVTLGGHEFVRASSVMGSPLALGHFLLVPFALALERAMRGRTRGAIGQAVLIGAGILLTQTRSALLGAGVIVLIVLRRSPGRSEQARSRFWLVLVGAFVAAAPFIVSAGMLDRFSDEGSTTAHQEGFFNGVSVISEHPLGQGLGTSAGVGQRFSTASSVSENYYLQVGAETGVLGLALFVGFVLLVSRELRRARDQSGDPLVTGARAGFVGIAVAAFFLHAFNNQTVAWSAFAVAGLALGVTVGSRDREGPIGATIEGSHADLSLPDPTTRQGLTSQG
jgi:hypothetical protein